jgi:hypothetical protein
MIPIGSGGGCSSRQRATIVLLYLDARRGLRDSSRDTPTHPGARDEFLHALFLMTVFPRCQSRYSSRYVGQAAELA